MAFAIAGYQLRRGTGTDRALLVKFLGKTYQEAVGTNTFQHLAATVERHFSPETPVWWVETVASPSQTVGFLWLGNAVDQQQGDRHSYVLAVYVAPEHRRQGIATALLNHAQAWAQARGDRQIGLQVFADNEGAIALYRQLGFQTQSLWLTKPLP
ncbi:GNAT family N-acetyltransferase [Leptolyngbya iicbica]|uniref:N-acetyltransferase n=2 Tax=Cyanophyceae TaxID=3028117 RepID=A0A4V2E2P8_9CYAN|nr:N-acetyltransferase [Leptolyngbya sp. LK]RZM79306.1 N-acetyltransferase [Leptolyngbya sp. LK]